MIDKCYAFIIYGVPIAKQSFRYTVGKTKNGKHYAKKYQPEKIEKEKLNTRDQIIRIKLNEYPYDFPLSGNIVIEELTFEFPVLKSFSKKKLKVVQDGWKLYKNTQPDLDNLEKNLWDAAEGIVFINDAQIVEKKQVRKIYSFEPKTVLILREGG